MKKEAITLEVIEEWAGIRECYDRPVKHLAERTGFSVATIKRHLKKLEDARLIHKIEVRNGSKQPSIYTLTRLPAKEAARLAFRMTGVTFVKAKDRHKANLKLNIYGGGWEIVNQLEVRYACPDWNPEDEGIDIPY